MYLAVEGSTTCSFCGEIFRNLCSYTSTNEKLKAAFRKGRTDHICLDCYKVQTFSTLSNTTQNDKIITIQKMEEELIKMNKNIDPNAAPHKIEELYEYVMATKVNCFHKKHAKQSPISFIAFRLTWVFQQSV